MRQNVFKWADWLSHYIVPHGELQDSNSAVTCWQGGLIWQTVCVNTFYEQHRQAHITFWDNLKMTLKTYIIKFPMKNSNKILNSNNFKQKLLWKNAFCICCLSFWNYEHFREHIQGFSIVNKEENFFFQCTLNSKHHSMWETYFNTYVCWGCGYYYTHFIDRKSASKRWSKLHVCLLIKCQGHD